MNCGVINYAIIAAQVPDKSGYNSAYGSNLLDALSSFSHKNRPLRSRNVEVLLDGKEVGKSIAEDSTLKDALHYMQSNLCPKDHLVIGVRCNGEEIPSEKMEASLNEPISTLEKLEVTTSTREHLITDAMTQASISLEDTESTCKKVAELFTEGKNPEAIESLGECLRIWQHIHEAVGKSLIMLDVDPTTMMIQDESIDVVIRKPIDVLMQFKQALQSQDYVLLSDILEYEFSNVIDSWHSVIARIRQEAEEMVAKK